MMPRKGGIIRRMKQIWLMWLFARLVRKQAKKEQSAGIRTEHVRGIYGKRWWRRRQETRIKWQAFNRVCVDAINTGYLEEKEVTDEYGFKPFTLYLTTRGRGFVELDGLVETMVRERGKTFFLLVVLAVGVGAYFGSAAVSRVWEVLARVVGG